MRLQIEEYQYKAYDVKESLSSGAIRVISAFDVPRLK
jgi:hypothetical protein